MKANKLIKKMAKEVGRHDAPASPCLVRLCHPQKKNATLFLLGCQTVGAHRYDAT